MNERWYNLTDKGHNFVVAGLLRDRLFEQAIEKIELMIQQRIYVAPWLYDIAMYFLLDYQEIDEAYHLAIMRRNAGNTIMSSALWMHLLDVAAKYHHVSAT